MGSSSIYMAVRWLPDVAKSSSSSLFVIAEACGKQAGSSGLEGSQEDCVGDRKKLSFFFFFKVFLKINLCCLYYVLTQ